MKKLVFILVVAMVAGIAITSCTNDHEFDNSPKELSGSSIHVERDTLGLKPIEYQNLMHNIEALNTELCPQSRGWWGDFWNGFRRNPFRVIVADAVGGLFGMFGGIVGSIAGATACSAAAVFTQNVEFLEDPIKSRSSGGGSRGITFNDNPDALDDLVFETRDYPGLSDSTGYYHNLILLDVLKNGGVYDSDVTIVVDEIYAETAETFGIPESQLKEDVSSSDDLNTFFENELYNDEESATFSEYCARMKTLYPHLSNDIDVFEQIMMGLLNIPNLDETNYVQTIINYINNSSIGEQHKQNLINATIIGNASSRLWDENYGE